MKKHSIFALLICSIFFQITPHYTTVYATEIESETNDADAREFNPVTINYILEGVETKLKSTKVLDKEDDFWDDYTVKLSNKLMYGSIDIQDKIRNYYFSHYEIAGRRIESLDAIVTLKEDSPVINVIYSEEAPKDGYLRKGFRNGIALDFEYIFASAQNNSTTHTELYDDTWSIEISNDLNNEIVDSYEDMVNANDKTLYFNVETNPIPIKEQAELINKYNYIDSIKLTSSLGYKDFENPLKLKYSPATTSTELNDKEICLYGINLEGKIDLITTSTFENDSVTFNIDKNTNKYQFLFVSSKEKDSTNEISVPDDLDSSRDESDIKQEGKEDTIIEKPTSPKDELANLLENKDEEKIVLLILACFATGAASTFLLSLIFSTRNANIEKRKLKDKNNNRT